MSGGHFDIYSAGIAQELYGEWRDEEINELFFDLFGAGWSYSSRPFGYGRDMDSRKSEFGPRGGGLFESLDFYLSGDTSEDDYLDDVRRFKKKWLVKSTPKNRVEFYQNRFEEYAREIMDKFKDELVEV